ncbi:MAG: hypothetical protein JJT96_07935 [Opitutales bacterium]|nr:hypothetical protein [Opitutales bacterium]
MKNFASFLHLCARFSAFRRVWVLLLAATHPALVNGQAAPCIEFENFAEGTTFSAGQTIAEAGFPMTIGTYTDGSEVSFESAFMRPSALTKGNRWAFRRPPCSSMWAARRR